MLTRVLLTYVAKTTAFILLVACGIAYLVLGEAAAQAVLACGLVVALDERGKTYRSEEWARWLGRALEEREALVFLLGGAYGLADSVLKQAEKRLSLSPFTFGHELALLVLMEQLYRAFTILSGEPYHK
jgi:23S rRNA (pseudouridine1915-N3)-methyltransferase